MKPIKVDFDQTFVGACNAGPSCTQCSSAGRILGCSALPGVAHPTSKAHCPINLYLPQSNIREKWRRSWQKMLDDPLCWAPVTAKGPDQARHNLYLKLPTKNLNFDLQKSPYTYQHWHCHVICPAGAVDKVYLVLGSPHGGKKGEL